MRYAPGFSTFAGLFAATLLLPLAGNAVDGSSAATSALEGWWAGTYQDQPTTLRADGTFPENVVKFELRLRIRKNRVVGKFRSGNAIAARKIVNARWFDDHFCFDVIVDRHDMRWCVEAKNNLLIGSWNGGPEGGPALGGAGVGARVFGLEGRRVPQ